MSAIGHTEAEAKTKWCAKAPEYSCSGSQCMAWRWISALTVNNPMLVPGEGVQNITRERGYCGLAGRL